MVETRQSPITVSSDTQGPDEVEIARRALASLNPDDEGYLPALDALAHSLVSRSLLSGNPIDLDEGISLSQTVLHLAPPGHPFHLAAVCSMGPPLIKRFKFRGDANDMTEAISYLEAALELCMPEESNYLPSVANLASGLLNRYWRYGDVKDLNRIIEASSTALSVCPPESPNRDVLFNNLATALKERFLKQGNRADLDTALKHYQSCLGLRPPGHRLRYTILANLGDVMMLIFEVDGQLQDLESAANHYGSALQLRSPGQEGYIPLLMSLGTIFIRLYYAQGDLEKMEMAIDCYKTALEHSVTLNLDHSRLLDNYSAALQERYSLSGDTEDLDQAIKYLIISSEILPPTYSGRPVTLFHLGNALMTRYNAAGDIADLDSSIEKFASALALCQPGFHQRSAMLSVYGRALSARFHIRGDVQDLSLAASACRDALASSSPKDLNYASMVANLTSTLLEWFHRSRNMEECETIIDYCDRALVTVSEAEPAFISLKTNRAKAFLQKFQHERAQTDIDTSISEFREILPMLPKGHAKYVSVHLEFGIALETRFKLSADLRDLDESIALYRVAKHSCERRHVNYVPVCMQLGNALRERFDNHQDSGDALDEAIVLLAEVEEILSPTPGHSDYKPSLINLGIALSMRFQAQRRGDDLDEAIDHVSRALALPVSYDEFLVPLNLATLLSIRYDENDDLEDLERCVELFAVAAEQMPPKHLSRGVLCRHYGHALVKLGHRRDLLHHLDTAIVFFQEALEHLPPSHHDQPLTYIRLAGALHERAQLRCDTTGLYDATNLLRRVLETLPEDSPNHHVVCLTAARLSVSMYELSKRQTPSFLADGFRHYEKAVRHTRADSFMEVVGALEWAERADKYDHASAWLAYRTSLDVLNRHLLATASVKSRRAALLEKRLAKQTSTLATNATACAIAQGELTLAVELSEQGRGLLWSQMSQSRTPLEVLRSASDAGRTLASDFERVSAQLARSAVAESLVTASRLTVEEAAQRYRRSSKELDDIVARIRQQEGFQSFLDRPSFADAQRAALGGPVILVNVSRRRCDALIVLHDGPPRLVPLPSASLEDLAALSAHLHHTLRTTTRVGDERTREREVAIVLRTLWDTVVCPIVDALSPLVPRGARIWWCPTSTLTSLPLHAAGPYRRAAQNLPNLYVSSYTPTLAALVRARRSSTRPPAFIAIGQAQPATTRGGGAGGECPAEESAPLHTIALELELVRSLVPPGVMPFDALPSDASTAAAALAALQTHTCAHLACHGRPHPTEPFDASFALRDRAVTLLDVVRNADAPGEFAFLSACHTAVGDGRAPDEVIHLAAGMQFAGFRSVIGTMWAVDDGTAHEMVRAFYTQLFSPSGAAAVWDCTQAARALNRAAKSVSKDAIAFDQRVVFIHIGA